MQEKEKLLDALNNMMKTSIHLYMAQLNHYSKEINVTMPQMNILFKLFRVKSITVNEVSEVFEISKPAASQLLDKLVTRGFIIREESTTDRRIKYHSLTVEGKKTITNFFKKVKGLTAEVVDLMELEEYQDKTEILVSLTDKMTKIAGEENKESKC